MTLRVVKQPSREPAAQAAVWNIRRTQYLKARRWDALVELVENAGNAAYPDPVTENARKVLNQHVGRILTEIDEELSANDTNIREGRKRVDPARPYQLRVIWENYAAWFRRMSDPKNLQRGTERLSNHATGSYTVNVPKDARTRHTRAEAEADYCKRKQETP